MDVAPHQRQFGVNAFFAEGRKVNPRLIYLLFPAVDSQPDGNRVVVENRQTVGYQYGSSFRYEFPDQFFRGWLEIFTGSQNQHSVLREMTFQHHFRHHHDTASGICQHLICGIKTVAFPEIDSAEFTERFPPLLTLRKQQKHIRRAPESVRQQPRHIAPCACNDLHGMSRTGRHPAFRVHPVTDAPALSIHED